MPKAIYRGPGDSVELDGVKVEKGKSIELTHEQINRVRASDPQAVIDIAKEKSDARTA